MTRKWGSCSTAGTITLAADLAEQSRRFQDFVVAHELLHLRVPNHARLFKALMTAHVPGWRAFEMERRNGSPKPQAMSQKCGSGKPSRPLARAERPETQHIRDQRGPFSGAGQARAKLLI